MDQQAIAREGPQESASGGLLLLPSRVWGQALTVDAVQQEVQRQRDQHQEHQGLHPFRRVEEHGMHGQGALEAQSWHVR